MKIFLDTEFTDFVRPHLISIGMAADSGGEFYAEIPYPSEECSEFVVKNVIPLLEKSSNKTLSKQDLASSLQTWLAEMRSDNEDIEICFDSQNDWDLFIDVLFYNLPKWCKQKQINGLIDEALFCKYLNENNLPEHHALHDAKANRFAYKET